MPESDIAQIASLPPFRDLPLALVEELIDHGLVQTLPAESELFAQGAKPRFLHVILEGSVALIGTALDSQGGVHEAVVEIFGPGEMIIAPAVILDLPYLMAARVLTRARIVLLPAKRIRELLTEQPGFCHAMTLTLARHWRLLARQLKEQKLKTSPQRLGSYLLGLARGAEGSARIELPFDRRTMASHLGMSAENCSRSLAHLASIGVKARGRRVDIADLSRLHEYCQEDDLR